MAQTAQRVMGLAAAAAACSLAAPALAETSASFQASATVVAGCEVNGVVPASGANIGEVGSLDFGTHSALATSTVTAALAPNAGLNLSCTPSVALTMSLDGGLHAAATRNLQATGSADRIAYRLYRDAAFSEELVANQAFAVSFGNPEAITLPIYGRLALPGNVPADSYGDTVVVTLAW